MRQIRFVLFSVFISTSLFATDENCKTKPASTSTAEALAKAGLAICNLSIEQQERILLISECEKAGFKIKENSGVKSVAFTEFGNMYNTADKHFYCKNKAGFDSSLAQRIKKSKEEVDLKQLEENRKKELERQRAPDYRPNPVINYGRSEKSKGRLWQCRGTTLAVTKNLTETQKNDIEDTLGTSVSGTLNGKRYEGPRCAPMD